jgi:uncharacterized protein YdeI (YjbR/CyaY-like superfamily)
MTTAKNAQDFRAALEKVQNNLGWTIARVPFEPTKVWKTMLRLRIRGEILGPGGSFAFRSSLFPDSRGGFCLLVNEAMQRAAGVRAGSTAEFRLQPDLEPRPAELPEELDALLDEAEGLRSFFDNLSEYTRREIGKWILVPKSDATRLKRAEQMAERLLATMEAELDLPPLLKRAFRARPKAKIGWAKMTPAQRRNGLFAVFYYQTPEAREKRVQKLCGDAEKKA